MRNLAIRSLRGGTFVLAMWAGAVASADTLWVMAGGAGSSIPYYNVHIDHATGEGIFFSTDTGISTSKSLAQISRIALEDEPAFSAGEEAFAAGSWDLAAENYQKAVRSTNKAWVRSRAAVRLIDAAGKAHRFDAATTAYIALAKEDPALAAKLKPALPEGGSTYLQTAAEDVNHAVNSGGISEASRQALLSFLLDIDRARGDTAGAGDVAEQLLRLNAGKGDDPAAARALADFKLAAARTELEHRQYDKVQLEIQANRGLFIEPRQQEEALFDLAEARLNLAKNDATSLKDAALDYMRVVANFKELPQPNHVAVSLLRTGQIYEKLNEPQTARELYQQVVAQFPGSAAAGEARAALGQMK